MASTSSSSTDAKEAGNAFEDILKQPLLPSVTSSSSSMVYDVFLNHRGCDVKEGLAKDLYHALNLRGLRVFLDKEVLEYGDSIPREIQDAMLSSSMCIAIFSPKYAESPWCLNELSFMLNNNTKIIPIFYNVEPSDLRWVAKGKGVYAKAFSGHEEKRRHMPQKLEEWKTALFNASLLNGQELKSKEDEDMLLKTIVNSVLKDIGPLEVARYPVALDEIIDDFKRSAFESSDREQDVDIVGIVGMGGSGKTTLAKALYNKECLNFDRHIFIFDVRDAADTNTLHNLQRKLLRGLLSEKFDLSIDNITEGKEILRIRLSSLRVLIVLDDVGHVDHIDALLPEKGIFAAGSLIIVTTRELDVLQFFDISPIYRMKTLKPFHGQQLLCWHAFRQPGPVQEFEDLVEKVMNACHGLPLSLKVLGAQLYKKPKAYWDSLLDKISRILHKDIAKILKISFDALDGEEKEMFLDTACFFLGEEKSLAIEVWNGSGWSGLHGWETLLSKCLVELDQWNRIGMHDHLRDMGRQIAKEWPPYRLFPSSNLDICGLVQERKPIRGIMEASTDRSLYTPMPSSDYRPLFKEYMEFKPSRCGVKLLVGENNEFSEEYAPLSKELRWLRLFKFQHSCLPPWLSLENLGVLELYDAPALQELWQDNMQQPPLQLRELIIYLGWENRSFQRFPRSIGRLRHLKKLCFTWGSCLQNLPKEFCNLQSLEHLVLENLEGLLSLPRCFGDLTNLRHLSLAHCSLPSLPRCFGDLTNLRHLNLAKCFELKMLPNSFKQLKHLQYLNLKGCSNLTFTEHNADILENITKLEYLSFDGCKGLQVLPHHITQQAYLRELHLEGTSFSELPSGIAQLERLEVLTIGSPKLESLLDSLGNLSSLTCLRLTNNSFLEQIRILPRTVKSIALCNCKRLKDIAGIGSLPNLQDLFIGECPELAELPSFAGFASMKKFHIRGCQNLGKIVGLEQLTSLERLYVHTQWELPGITSLEHAQRLTELRLSADKIGAVEPCIKTLQKWPGEVIICGRASSVGVASLVKAFTASNLVVVEADETERNDEADVYNEDKEDDVEEAEETQRNDEADVYDEDEEDEVEKADVYDEDEEYDVDEEADEDGCRLKYRKTYLSVESNLGYWWTWRFEDPETCWSHGPTIECFVINCLSRDHASTGSWMMELREGKWVWIRVVSKGRNDSRHLQIEFYDKRSRVEKGFLARGEARGVKDVFYQVLDALKM